MRVCKWTWAIALLVISAQAALASNVTLTLYPNVVPDEQVPRGVNSAPAGWGSSSWQGPATGKSNLQLRFVNDGNLLGQLFPSLSSMTINDLASLSYNTNQNGEPAGRDWWITIYTAKTGSGDASSWYHQKFTSNYGTHNNNTWTEYSTVNGNAVDGILFDNMTLASLQSSAGTQKIESIAIQTDSGWNGFDGYVDGITITTTGGDIGRANLAAVPLPAAAFMGISLIGGVGGIRGIKKRLCRQTA